MKYPLPKTIYHANVMLASIKSLYRSIRKTKDDFAVIRDIEHINPLVLEVVDKLQTLHNTPESKDIWAKSGHVVMSYYYVNQTTISFENRFERSSAPDGRINQMSYVDVWEYIRTAIWCMELYVYRLSNKTPYDYAMQFITEHHEAKTHSILSTEFDTWIMLLQANGYMERIKKETLTDLNTVISLKIRLDVEHYKLKRTRYTLITKDTDLMSDKTLNIGDSICKKTEYGPQMLIPIKRIFDENELLSVRSNSQEYMGLYIIRYEQNRSRVYRVLSNNMLMRSISGELIGWQETNRGYDANKEI